MKNINIIAFIFRIKLRSFLFLTAVFISIFLCNCKGKNHKTKQTEKNNAVQLFNHNQISFHITNNNDSYILMDRQKYLLKQNNLIYKDSGKTAYRILTFENKLTGKIIPKIKQLLDNSETFFIKLKPDKLSEKTLKELSSLGFKRILSSPQKQYFAYSYRGFIVEIIENKNIDIILPAEYHFLRKTDEMKKQFYDHNRFIAHAGGEINGKTYTNSLEALNNSYKNGFKLFELDINKTSDGKFAATHSWKEWSKKNGFDENYIPDYQTFLSKKISNRYSPAGIDEINRWFSRHKDAVLVTDKVNTPKEFAEQFIDKNRLMMEVFDLNAFDEAYENKITAMLNWDIFLGKKDEEILQTVQKHHIKYLTASRRQIAENKNIFLKLKDKGVRIYLFHVNYDPYKDEKYVFLHELDYAYGMYADKWYFNR